MQVYGKMAGNAVAAMSYLAERYEAEGGVSVGSAEIVERRGISRPLVGKILTQLSQVGLVEGVPGPRGGYRLARAPEAISLYEIVSEFERVDRLVSCPFGAHWCGNEAPCPLHERLVWLQGQAVDFLRGTSLSVFREGGGNG